MADRSTPPGVAAGNIVVRRRRPLGSVSFRPARTSNLAVDADAAPIDVDLLGAQGDLFAPAHA